jgi:hypothetical protein
MPCTKPLTIPAGALQADPPIPYTPFAVALPSLASRGLCEEFLGDCTALFAFGGKSPDEVANCTAVLDSGGLRGKPNYPATPTLELKITLNAAISVPVTMQVNQMDSDAVKSHGSDFAVSGRTACPAPIAYDPKLDTAGNALPCGLPCPSPLWTKGQYELVRDTLIVEGLLGCLGTMFVFVTFLTFKVKRRFPGNLVFYFAVSSFNISFALLVGAAAGPERVLCHDPFTEADLGDSLCGWQGTWILFWALATAAWWGCIALNLYLGVALNMTDTARFGKYYHCAAWGLPVVMTGTCLAAGKIGNAKSPWCFILEDDNFAWQYACFYAWIGLVTVIGIYSISSVIVKMFQISKWTGKSLTLQLRTQMKPMGFAMMIIIVFSGIFTYRVNQTVEGEALKQGFVDFIACRVQAAAIDDAAAAAECRPDPKASFGMYYAITITTGLQGILLFLFYGMTADNFWSWMALVGVKTSKGSSQLAVKKKRNRNELLAAERAKQPAAPAAAPKPKPKPAPGPSAKGRAAAAGGSGAAAAPAAKPNSTTPVPAEDPAPAEPPMPDAPPVEDASGRQSVPVPAPPPTPAKGELTLKEERRSTVDGACMMMKGLVLFFVFVFRFSFFVFFFFFFFFKKKKIFVSQTPPRIPKFKKK